MAGDDAAVLRASLGDPARFEAVFDRHHTAIWRYLARIGGPACADDLASEVFVVAFRRRASFDPARGSVVGWLYGIATNLARTRARSAGRGTRALAVMAAAPGEDGSFEDEVGDRDLLRRTRHALDELSDAHRDVLVLSVWEGLSYADIASALGVEVGTVRSRLSRARQALRELVLASGEVDGYQADLRRTPDG